MGVVEDEGSSGESPTALARLQRRPLASPDPCVWRTRRRSFAPLRLSRPFLLCRGRARKAWR